MATENQKTSIRDVEELDELLSEPAEATIHALAALEGDIVILGVGGKMGPTLARMAKRASEAAGIRRRVIGVSRFSSLQCERQLQDWDVETVRCDLLDRAALSRLPEAANVVYMAGMKFGSTGQESLTWAMNSFLPGSSARDTATAESRHSPPAMCMDFAQLPSKDRERATRSIPWANMQ